MRAHITYFNYLCALIFKTYSDANKNRTRFYW